MYPNLDAEQKRNRESNSTVAELLGISRVSYESKKKSGKFTAIQCWILCAHYQKEFEYLFSTSIENVS